MTVRHDPVVLNEPLLVALARARARGRSTYMVAADAGVHPSEISRWINLRKIPTRTQAERIAAALGYSVDELFSQVRKPGDPEDSGERGRA